jgi:hypothetical protein
MRTLADAVQSNARQAVADMSAANAADRSASGRQIQQKLGTTGPDLVFVPTAGPCRVADTRLGISANWPGPVLGFAGRQIYVWSTFAGFDWSTSQGGTGQAGVGNCVGDVFSGVTPVAVVATISVTNTSSVGALRAWDGTVNLTTGAVASWVAFGTQANTTVVPIDRNGVIYPGSGPFKKDIGVYNNSSTPVDVIVDVIGYFIENTATPLECTTVAGTSFSLTSGSTVLQSTPSCPTGYTPIMGQPVTNQFGIYTGTILQTSCRINNATGGTVNNLSCDALCCRIPGR